MNGWAKLMGMGRTIQVWRVCCCAFQLDFLTQANRVLQYYTTLLVVVGQFFS